MASNLGAEQKCQKSNSDERVIIPDRLKKILDAAKEYLSRKEYGKALSYYAYIVHSAPLLSNHIHDDFLFALKSWGSILSEHGKIDDLIKCFQEATRLFPNSAEIANNIGSALFHLNLLDDAAVYFSRAIKLDPDLSRAVENLDSISNILIERWHFRMLNDKLRNEAYRNAIDRAIKNGFDRVLDIGSGTCILSMFAVQSGANKVHACEMSKTMYNLSLDILAANQMQDSVHVINKKSHDLTIPEDLPGRVSLIVTETLDCGLLGEGIIETLTHAKHQLLGSSQKAGDNNVTQVIPEGAIVFGQLIQCEKIKNYSQVKSQILGHDVSDALIRGGEFSEKGKEPYTTEEMSCIKHVPLSETFQIMSYDFQTPEKYTKEIKHQLNISVVVSGCLDAVMVWFELKLDPHETLSSAPGHSVCWEQAIYPCQLPEGGDIVVAGDQVFVDIRLTSSAIFLEVAMTHSQPSSKFHTRDITLPYKEISKLNDVQLSENCNAALSDAFKELQISPTQHLTMDISHGCIVLCNAPSFNPLFALWSGLSPVLCVSNDTNFMQCLKTLAGDQLCFTEQPLEELAGGKDWEVLIVDPVEPGGLLRQGVVEDIVLAKGCVLSKNAGLVLPRKIQVWGMLVSSSSLCQKSSVTAGDVTTLGLDIARYMNMFQVKNQIDVDIESNKFESLTDPELLLTLDFMKPCDDDSLLSLLNATCDRHVTAAREGSVDGLMYWFVLDYTESRHLSTGPMSGSHFNQVVIMFKEKLAVVCGQQLLIRTICKNSCVTASVQ